MRSPEAAEDAVQEAFIKAFRALATFRGGAFRAWFLRIVINTCYSQLRQPAPVVETSVEELAEVTDKIYPLVAGAEQPDLNVERLVLRDWLAQGMETLPFDQRVAVALHDLQGFSYEEMVEIMGVPIGTVKSRLHRGRVKLRNYLLQQPDFTA